MAEKKRLMRINPKDNVAVAVDDIRAGESFIIGSDISVTAATGIRNGHKVAIRGIPKGEDVVKYGAPIGRASHDIAKGEHVHGHNLTTGLSGKLEYAWNPEPAFEWGAGGCRLGTGDVEGVTGFPPTFDGYRRKDGSAGIRNEIWIIPTVGCVNRVAERLAMDANRLHAGKTDGFFAWPHPYGCSQLGDDHLHTQLILTSLAKHPNAGGVLILGLGCENNNILSFRDILGSSDPERIRFLETQGVMDECEVGGILLAELANFVQGFQREPIPVSELVVGLKCGGSDGLSGITANPLAGMFSDRLITAGGTSILTEVPEMFGAETILMKRCADAVSFDRTVALINDFKDYYLSHNQVVYENPSPGNKDGGITTLEEKSLGCIQKGGTSPVKDVLFYGEHIRKTGLNLAQGPGNDIVSVTTLAAAGAHLILFTTGRGTPLGGPVPTVKIATNDALYSNKPHWIDFNAGRSLKEQPEKVTDDLVALVNDIVSGKRRARNEENGYREIAIFKNGVTL